MVNAHGFSLLAVDALYRSFLSRFDGFASYSQVTLARFSLFTHAARRVLPILPLTRLRVVRVAGSGRANESQNRGWPAMLTFLKNR